MPFKKRKEAKEQRAVEIKDGRADVEKKFDAAIMKAAEMVDPAAKVLALKGIASDISVQLKNESNAITNKAKSHENKTELAGRSVAYAGAASAFIFGGPIGWIGAPIMVAGILGSGIIASKRKNAVTKKLRQELGDHLGNLQSQSLLISEMINIAVENNVEPISKSPLYSKVMALPGIADVFAEAAAKHIAAVKAAEAAAKIEAKAEEKTEAAPPAAEEPKAPPAKKKPANFDRITKVGKQF